jgi:thiol-disulfide isomerase/thioredoxin
MNTTGKKKTGKAALFLFCILSLVIHAQKPRVYKTDKLISRYQKKNDTLYVVNFWATWCKPCVAELPAFEKVSLEYKNKPVKVILVTLDFKETLKNRVIPFLKKNKYTAEVVLLDEVDGNKFINKIDSSWTGAIPATLLRMDGKTKFVEKQLKYEELKTEIAGFGK